MRPLTPTAALRCENACGGRCRCRCGGKLHGAGRVREETALATTLEADDPHYIDPARLAELRRPRQRRGRRRLVVGEQLDLCDLPQVWSWEKPMQVRPIDPENVTGVVACLHESEKCNGPLYELLSRNLCQFHLIVLRNAVNDALAGDALATTR